MKIVDHLYPQIISIENLLIAWEEFVKDKKKKADVIIFSRHLLQYIFSLHHDLVDSTYKHSNYQRFNITDPKERIIHKAIVRDRLLHHAIYRILCPIFDKGFIFDSYSCRLNKGTHKAVDRLEVFIRKVSKNYSGQCLALKCDVKKFFNSVDHDVLLEIMKRKIDDADLLWLLNEVLSSFGCENATKQLALFAAPSERERERERANGLRPFR